MKFAICAFLICFNALKANAEFLWVNEGDKKIKLEFKIANSIRRASLCDQELDCLAIKAVKMQTKIPEFAVDPMGLAVNPMMRMCQNLGGRNRIAHDLYLRQYDICIFKDKSFFLTQDFFRKFSKASKRQK